MAADPLPDGWRSVGSPPSLFRRFEFSRYDQTRDLLDRLAELSRQTGVYPDLGFGRTHVNVTLYAADGGPVGDGEWTLARRIDELADAVPR